MDMFVDTDFAGLWWVKSPTDPISVKSRTGYVISISGCYLLAKSCLQTSIAQSTGESEYIALSHGHHALLPIHSTLVEILALIGLPDHLKDADTKFKTLVHEENKSALILDVDQCGAPRTKHYDVKMHWFWSIINDLFNNIKVVQVDTKVQQADYLTKVLPSPEFITSRKFSQGW